jgi:prenyltransferase beta subunit
LAVRQANICYSWWILLVLSIIGWVGWIDTSRLGQFILNCQDDKDGGIANRPWDMPDVYHTYFGLCGLSLIGHMEKIGNRRGGHSICIADGCRLEVGPACAGD